MSDTIACASLYERTLHLVRNAPRSLSYTDMSKGSGLSIGWISRFADGKFDDPGVKKVQSLHDFLSNVGS